MSILTISRQLGSGGREIACAVAARLFYRVVTKEVIFEAISKDGGKWEAWGKELDERCPTVWEKYDWSFRGFGSLLQLHILEQALQDHVVILGRGGNFLLQGVPHALRVRVVAPLGMRVDRIVTRDSVDVENARWLAEKTDYDRSCFIRALYGRPWDDPGAYDMVCDMGNETVDEAAARIAGILSGREAHRTKEAETALQMLVLSARIRARILTDPSFLVPLLDVRPSDNVIVIKGVVHNPGEHKRIEETAQEIAGEISVRCELHYRG